MASSYFAMGGGFSCLWGSHWKQHTLNGKKINTFLLSGYKGQKGHDMKEKTFPAEAEALDEVNSFIEEELENAGCGPKEMMQISVALEEIFVNVAHYAYTEGKGDVKIGIKIEDNKAYIRFRDRGTPFNPLERRDPDISLSAEERNIGGLGIFMVKKTMDDVTYEHVNGENVLTIIKTIN